VEQQRDVFSTAPAAGGGIADGSRPVDAGSKGSLSERLLGPPISSRFRLVALMIRTSTRRGFIGPQADNFAGYFQCSEEFGPAILAGRMSPNLVGA